METVVVQKLDTAVALEMKTAVALEFETVAAQELRNCHLDFAGLRNRQDIRSNTGTHH